jgi:hypothetical protein
MLLQTSFPIPESPDKITSSSRVISMGSCFAENMGARLENLPIKVLNQPLGTIFHPITLARILDFIPPNPADCYEHQGFFNHPDFSSRFTHSSPEILCQEIRKTQEACQIFIKQANWIILTFGTSFQYFDNHLNKYIGNCHKQPASRFTKHLSSLAEMSQAMENMLEKLKKENPGLRVILTVSPVRHTKEGMPENSLSKSLLRVLADSLCKKYASVWYFPAYEIMLDELRDYRFYESDLIHPSKQAQDFIYQKTKECYFSAELMELDLAWQSLRHMLDHRPHPLKIDLHQSNIQTTFARLKQQFKGIDLSSWQAKINAHQDSL